MKVSRNTLYNYGWSDPRSYTQTIKTTSYTHTRTIVLELINDPHTSTIKHNTVAIHNDDIHGVINGNTNSERV